MSRQSRAFSIVCPVCGTKGIDNFTSLGRGDAGLMFNQRKKVFSYAETRILECNFCHAVSGHLVKREPINKNEKEIIDYLNLCLKKCKKV